MVALALEASLEPLEVVEELIVAKLITLVAVETIILESTGVLSVRKCKYLTQIPFAEAVAKVLIVPKHSILYCRLDFFNFTEEEQSDHFPQQQPITSYQM